MPSLKQISDIGEYKLIERILSKHSLVHPSLILGAGDDAAVLSIKKKEIVITKDIFVERVHFSRKWSSFFQIGYKSVVANVSDIAAMGGAKNLSMMVGLATPVDISVDNVDNLNKGIMAAAKKYGISLIGGDTVLSKKDIVISITLLGEVDGKNIITRSGASPGEKICCIGTFGDSAAGLEILKKGRAARDFKVLALRHLMPEARMVEAIKLSSTGKITAMIDSSDGLAACVSLISKKSGVGANVELSDIPLSSEFRLWARNRKNFPWEKALNGGEEYNLVFMIKPENMEKVRKKIKFSVIGETTKKNKIEYFDNGKKTKFNFTGFQNF